MYNYKYESGNLLEAYGYDELGRLKTEQNVKGQYYAVYEYDADGNIQSKTKYYCASTAVVTSPTGTGTTYIYTYDSVWKDRLTKYSGYGNNMSYVGGNPTSYQGRMVLWEKGRQLKQLGTNVYKYNASGIRIGKTVGGVEHKYTVEGTNILREEYGEHVLDYLYGVDGKIVGFTYDRTTYYYEKNLQGDVIRRYLYRMM